MMVKIDYEKLKQAMDLLYQAVVEYNDIHYIEGIETDCFTTTRIKGLENYIEVPTRYLPMLALKLLMEFEHVKTMAEITLKRFKEGVWE